MIGRSLRASLLAIVSMSLVGLLLVASGSMGAQDEPGCTAKARVDRTAAGAKKVGISVKCDYHVHSIEIRAKGRRFSWVAKAPKPSGSGSAGSTSCHRRGQHQVICRGDLSADSGVIVMSRIDRSACANPQARFAVSVSGVPECSGVCPEVGIRTDTTTPVGRSLGCS